MPPPSQDLTETLNGITRRGFLRAGAVGIGALGAGLTGRGAVAVEPGDRTRSVILLLLVGGPSQLETWDPKPEAPLDIRGPFRSIATSCPGVRICEHLPLMAARMNHLALIRSMYHHSAPIHETGRQLLQTGRVCQCGEEHPHFGSVVARLTANGQSPPFVVVPRPIEDTGMGLSHGQSAGWLGPRFEPCALDAESAAAVEAPLEYGVTSFGRSCHLARRLVEAGVRVVTVNMCETVFGRETWDCHGRAPFGTLADYAGSVLPTFDRAFAALIDDLESRGLLETTLVVAAGEFGRSPMLNQSGGRDHWPGVWSIALAGGGVRGGQVIGSSDAHAGSPADRPVSLPDLLATVYFSLGIDASIYLDRPGGEPYGLVHEGAVIHELFA